MKLIRQKYNYHVSLDTVEEFEEIILSDRSTNTIKSISEINKKISKILFYILNLLAKNNIGIKNKVETPIKMHNHKNQSSSFAVLMGPDFSKCLPFFLFSMGFPKLIIQMRN